MGRAGADWATIPRAGVQISLPEHHLRLPPNAPAPADCARIPWFIVHPMIKVLSSESSAGPNIYPQPLDR